MGEMSEEVVDSRVPQNAPHHRVKMTSVSGSLGSYQTRDYKSPEASSGRSKTHTIDHLEVVRPKSHDRG